MSGQDGREGRLAMSSSFRQESEGRLRGTSSPGTPSRKLPIIPPPPPSDPEPVSPGFVYRSARAIFESGSSTPVLISTGKGPSSPEPQLSIETQSRPQSPISSPRRRKFPLLPPITTSGLTTLEQPLIKDEYPIFNVVISSSCRKSGNPSSFIAYLPAPISSVYGVRPISINLPPPHNITDLNSKLSFARSGRSFTISVPCGSYSVTSLIDKMESLMCIADRNNYRFGYDSSERKFSVQGKEAFSLMFSDGKTNSIASTLGWKDENTTALTNHFSTLPCRLDENVGVCILLSRFVPRGITTGGSKYCFRASSAPGKKRWAVTGSAPSREKEFKDLEVTLLDDYGSLLPNWGEWSMEIELQMVPRQSVRDASYVFGTSPIPSRPSSPELLSSPRARAPIIVQTSPLQSGRLQSPTKLGAMSDVVLAAMQQDRQEKNEKQERLERKSDGVTLLEQPTGLTGVYSFHTRIVRVPGDSESSSPRPLPRHTDVGTPMGTPSSPRPSSPRASSPRRKMVTFVSAGDE